MRVNWHPSLPGVLRLSATLSPPSSPHFCHHRGEHGDGILIFWTPVEAVENDLARIQGSTFKPIPRPVSLADAAVPSGTDIVLLCTGAPHPRGRWRLSGCRYRYPVSIKAAMRASGNHPLTVEWPITKI